MNWAWIVSQGLISGDPVWYQSGKATADEYANAVKTAYLNATDANRKELVDQLWSTGAFEGNKEHWYTARPDEVGNLATAAMKMKPQVGTGAKGAGARFSIAGGAELWKNADTDKSYIVYQVPDSEPPMFISYEVPSQADLQSFFGPEQPIVYNRTLAGNANEWKQALLMGTTDAVSNTSDNPFAAWSTTLANSAKTQPWLLDDDYQRLFAVAIIEKRELRPDEIALTKWYSTHNDAQRAWMQKFHMDPLSAQQELEANRITLTNYMRTNGMVDVDPKLAEFMADRWTKGDWTQQDAQWQAKLLTDPYFADQPVNTELQNFIDDNAITIGQTQDEGLEVREMVNRWLGTNFGQWSDAQINEWSGRFRNETDAREKLTEILKDQKSALFPEYDREADYETIASPWRNVMRNAWGEVPSDSDATLQNIIRINNATEAGKYLTTEGLARGNQTVVNNVQTALNRSFGGTAIG